MSFGMTPEQKAKQEVERPSAYVGKVRPRATSRLAIIIALVLIVIYWVPFAFLIGAFLTLSCWDDVLKTRSDHRRWFILWLLALAFVCASALNTVYLLPYLATM